jgi:polyhydroxyalkanoate synthesis repressor PhaR
MTNKEQVIIKRYQNRKLYDTRNSTYVTLDDISRMIKAGEDVQIIDNRNKDDLTAVTLAQILFEEEKKKKSLLPLAALKRIIQEGGGTIKEFFEKTIDTGVSSFSRAKEEAEKVIGGIKEKLTPDDEGILQEVLHRTQDFSKKIDEKIKSTVESVAQVTSLQNEIRNLHRKIMLLEKKLTDYEKNEK